MNTNKFPKIPEAGQRDWAADLQAVLRLLVRSVIALYVVVLFLTVAVAIMIAMVVSR